MRDVKKLEKEIQRMDAKKDFLSLRKKESTREIKE